MVNLPPTGLSSSPLYPWIFWHLWKSRNLLLFEDRAFSEEETVAKAIFDAKVWHEAQVSLSKPRAFKPPPPSSSRSDAISCFVDAAWNASSRCCGMGWVIQDTSKDLSVRSSSHREFVSSALVAEALAMRSALVMAASITDIDSLAVFSDSQVLVSLINSKGCVVELRSILYDISLLRQSFVSISFAYVPRSNNIVADDLAKMALASVSCTSPCEG